jgi:hypothetical protein
MMWARTVAFFMLVPWSVSLGCDALSVHPFAGTVMEFTMANAPVTPPGQHLELWARDRYNDIIRVDGYYDEAKGLSSPGFMIRQAISLQDPCVIDDTGNRLTSPAAYPTTITQNGVQQTPQEQAAQIVDRINQLQKDVQGNPLLAVLPYDPNLPPSLPDATPADMRLAACQAYTSQSALTYVANPLLLTAPKHGSIYGFVRFVSVAPPQNFNAFRVDTPVNLKGVQEVFFTVEGGTVDPHHRGPLYLYSTATQGGRGVIHFNLIHADPNSTVSGAVALYVDLNDDPVQF